MAAVVALRPLLPPAKRMAAGSRANPKQASVPSAAQSGKSFARRGRSRVAKRLLRRQTESHRAAAHHAWKNHPNFIRIPNLFPRSGPPQCGGIPGSARLPAWACCWPGTLIGYSIYMANHEPDPQETVILGQTALASGQSGRPAGAGAQSGHGRAHSRGYCDHQPGRQSQPAGPAGQFQTDVTGTLTNALAIQKSRPEIISCRWTPCRRWAVTKW